MEEAPDVVNSTTPPFAVGPAHALAHLDGTIAATMQAAFAPSSAAQIKKEAFYFVRFCALYGLSHLIFARDELTFMRYIAFLSQTCNHDTISNYLHGIRVLYQQQGLGHPFTDMPFLAMLRRGVRRLRGAPPKKKMPVTPSMLRRWQLLLDAASPAHDALFACMLVAFFGFFRKSTVAPAGSCLADPDLHLRRRDITIDPRRYCLVIRVPKSKTNPYRERVDEIYIAGLAGCPLDPVAAYQRMVTGSPAPPEAPAFGFNTIEGYKPITHPYLVKSTKQYAAAIGLDPAEVSGHSYRRGGATFAFAAGVPDALIQQQGLWASLCYRGYIDTPIEARLMASTMMLARITVA